MLADAWCAQLGAGGWVLMGLFWATFLGLVLWAVSQLFGGDRGAGDLGVDEREVDDAHDLDLRLERGELDIHEYQSLRQESSPSGR